MAGKSEQIASMILERIRHGSYHTGGLPSLRELAAEFGVNYLTARQGVHLLCRRGILSNTQNRRYSIVNPPVEKGAPQVALLEAADGDNSVFCRLKALVEPLGGKVRRFIYSHYNDEMLTTVPDMDFDLILFAADPRQLPKMVLRKFIACREKLVSHTHDYTRYGIRSIIEPELEESAERLFELLESRGHRTFDVFMPRAGREIFERRINAFLGAAHRAGRVCNTHSYAMPHFRFDADVARRAASEVFSRSQPPDGIYVPSLPNAIAVMRGLYDIGYLAGRDYSLVASGEAGPAGRCIPSITVTASEDFGAAFREIIEKRDPEKLTYSLEPQHLFIGESLRPPE